MHEGGKYISGEIDIEHRSTLLVQESIEWTVATNRYQMNDSKTLLIRFSFFLEPLLSMTDVRMKLFKSTAVSRFDDENLFSLKKNAFERKED